MNKPTCSVDGCSKPHVARGYCEPHYGTAKRRGDFQVTKWSSEADRFWAKVEKTDTCWNWTAAVMGEGYGAFRKGGRLDGKLVRAHRYSYELTHGRIPEGLVVDHICHNRVCVRPNHLRVGTQKQNAENQQGVSRANKHSGVRNVHRSGLKSKPWRVSIRHHRKMYHFGSYATIEEAEAVAIRERARLFTFAD